MLFRKRKNKIVEGETDLCTVTLIYSDKTFDEYKVPFGTKVNDAIKGYTTIETDCHRSIAIDRSKPPRYNQNLIDAHNNCKIEITGYTSKPSKEETEFLIEDDIDTRLACQCFIEGNVTIHLPHEKLWHSYEDGIFDYLGNELRINEPQFSPNKENKKAVSLGNTLCIGYEIGVGTIRAMLCDVETNNKLGAISCLNPQYTLGQTLLKRMAYSRQGGAGKLWDVLVTGLNEITNELITTHNIKRSDIIRASIVGPTPLIMHFLGPNNIYLLNLPKEANECMSFMAPELGLDLDNNCELFVLPAIDETCSSTVFSELGDSYYIFDNPNEKFLQINLESECTVGLVSNGSAFFTRIDAEPVFGGSCLKCGAPYTDGAIIHCGYSNKFTFQTINNAKPIGITGMALVDIIAILIRRNVIKRNGLLKNNYTFYQINDEFHITSEDISNFVKAKALIRSAIDTLCENANITLKDITMVQVCGGFGGNYDINSLITTGIIPKELEIKSRSYGDLALKGACSAILNAKTMKKVVMAYRQTASIETIKPVKFANLITKYQGFELSNE